MAGRLLARPRAAKREGVHDSIAACSAGREKFKNLARNPKVDLFALVPTGKGHQTVLRGILLVVDHNNYHLGQLVAVRRALGIWK